MFDRELKVGKPVVSNSIDCPPANKAVSLFSYCQPSRTSSQELMRRAMIAEISLPASTTCYPKLAMSVR